MDRADQCPQLGVKRTQRGRRLWTVHGPISDMRCAFLLRCTPQTLQTWGPRRNRDLTAYAETAYMPIRLIPAVYRRLCDVQVEEGGNRSAHAGDVSAR
jgi:hypothetical protein